MIKGIVYCVLLIFVTYGAVIYNSASMIFLAGVGMILPLLLFIILLWQRTRLTISFLEPRYYVEKGERKESILVVSNRSRLPVRRLAVRLDYKNLTTGERKKQWIRKPLDTGITEIKVPRMALEYGVWSISGRKIRLFDFLKLCSVPAGKRVSCEEICLPDRYETTITETLPGADGIWESQEYEQNKSGNDASYIREIREYRPGDKLQNIHWKLSAKKEQLLIKEYGQPCGVSLLLGLSVNDLTKTGMELLYSLMTVCVKRHFYFILVWRKAKDGQIRQLPVTKWEDVYPAMEELMRTGIQSLEQEMRPVLPKKQIWLEEPVRLTLNGTVVQEFTEENLKEKLADMELIV